MNKKISKTPIKREAIAPVLNADKQKEAFLPILLATVCILIALAAVIIDRFVYGFSKEMLAPMISQVVILLIPTYLCILLIYPNLSPFAQLKKLGIARLHAEYIFLLIFTSLFMITTSLALNVLFGGVYPISEGFTLLGSFTAGIGEYTSSYPYLIVVYAAIPAIIEELLFRGLIYSLLSRINESIAIILSSIISALFAFTVGGFPAALFCALLYCFVRYTTGALQSCIIVHFLFNLYAVFAQTNIAKYFISSQNILLLLIVIIAVWLVTSILFFSEAARIFSARAKKIKNGEAASSVPTFNFKRLARELKDIASYRPTLISAIVLLVSFITVIVIDLF